MPPGNYDTSVDFVETTAAGVTIHFTNGKELRLYRHEGE
jgi:hypothetical protein